MHVLSRFVFIFGGFALFLASVSLDFGPWLLTLLGRQVAVLPTTLESVHQVGVDFGEQ